MFDDRSPMDMAGENTSTSGDFDADGAWDIFWHGPGA